MKNKGFSLVELIVVIAIMAILVGVAVPVYTSYISKAQKNADIQLSDEVKHAIEIGLVGDKDKPADFGGGVVVVLSGTGATVEGTDAEDKAFIDGVLADTFGSSWKTDLKLKYDGWESGTATTVAANYAGSTFDGKESELLGQVQNLANMLAMAAEANPNLIGGQGAFATWLSDNGLSGSSGVTAGNAAVLYVADVLADGTIDQEQYKEAVCDLVWGDGTAISTLLSGKSTAAIAAAMYATYEGLFQYAAEQGYEAPLEAWRAVDYNNITTPSAAVDAIGSAGDSAWTLLMTEDTAGNTIIAYTNLQDDDSYGADSPAKKDALAFLSTMSAVTESDDALLEKVHSTECYTDGDLLSKLMAYVTLAEVNVEDGEIAVIVNCDTDGTSFVVVYPIDY